MSNYVFNLVQRAAIPVSNAASQVLAVPSLSNAPTITNEFGGTLQEAGTGDLVGFEQHLMDNNVASTSQVDVPTTLTPRSSPRSASIPESTPQISTTSKSEQDYTAVEQESLASANKSSLKHWNHCRHYMPRQTISRLFFLPSRLNMRLNFNSLTLICFLMDVIRQ